MKQLCNFKKLSEPQLSIIGLFPLLFFINMYYNYNLYSSYI